MTDILMDRLVGLTLPLSLSLSVCLSVHMCVCVEAERDLHWTFFAQTVLVKSWWIKDGGGGKVHLFPLRMNNWCPSISRGNWHALIPLVHILNFPRLRFTYLLLYLACGINHPASPTLQRPWLKEIGNFSLETFINMWVLAGSSAVTSHYLIGIEMHLDRILAALQFWWR